MTHSITTVYIPTAKLELPDVRDAISTLRWIVGGMTRSEHVGSWLSDTPPYKGSIIEEPITTLEFITEHHSPKVDTFLSVIDRLVVALRESGEESVLITSSNTVASFK